MSAKPSLSVIIVQYGSVKTLYECLFSLHLHGPEGLREVLVINNDTRSVFDHISMFPFVKEVFLGKNMGFGTAANVGAVQAKGNMLIFLNPDAKPLLSDALDRLVFLAQKGGIVGARLLNERYRLEHWGGGKKMTLQRVLQKKIGCVRPTFFAKKREVFPTDWVSGAVFAVRRRDFLVQKGFDEKFFLYFEDADLCLRFHRAGFPVLYDAGAIILHRGGASFSEKKVQKKHYYESQQRYFQKHRPWWEFWLLKKAYRWFFGGRTFFE